MNALLAIAEVDPRRRTALDPTIFVEPRDRDDVSEIKRQNGLVNALRKHSRCMVFAVPNSAQTSRTKLRQLREGAIYGACDLIVTWTDGVAFVEMKDGNSSPRPQQVEFLNRLARQEHRVCVGRTAVGVMRWLASVGAPINVREGL
jgi:hypothetical protein